MIRAAIILAAAWLALGFWLYPATGGGVEVSGAKRLAVAARKPARKIRPRIAHRLVKRTQHAPTDTLTPSDRIIETYRALNWPKLPKD